MNPIKIWWFDGKYTWTLYSLSAVFRPVWRWKIPQLDVERLTQRILRSYSWVFIHLKIFKNKIRFEKQTFLFVRVFINNLTQNTPSYHINYDVRGMWSGIQFVCHIQRPSSKYKNLICTTPHKTLSTRDACYIWALTLTYICYSHVNFILPSALLRRWELLVLGTISCCLHGQFLVGWAFKDIATWMWLVICPPEHPTTAIWNNRIQNGRHTAEKVHRHLSKQGISWPVSGDHIPGAGLELIEVTCFLKLSANQKWFSIGSQAQARGFIPRFSLLFGQFRYETLEKCL